MNKAFHKPDRLSGASMSPDIPVAHAVPIPRRLVEDEELEKLTARFAGKSVGEKYLGPCWVGKDGIACVVFIALDEGLPNRIRTEGRCAAIAWRWNAAVPVNKRKPVVRGACLTNNNSSA